MHSDRDPAPSFPGRPHDAGPPEPIGEGTRIGLVVSSYHGELTRQMASSARRVLLEAGLRPEDVLELEAPGSFELPLVARRLAVRDDVHAVLCLGLVLKGETSHDQHIARECARGILQVSLETDKPVLFGVLTCDTLEQARERCQPGPLDKGAEAARGALQTLEALQKAAVVGTEPKTLGFGIRAPEARG
jgi:6,7-dimethyl-8-ribityllumazine synthase